MTLKELKQAIQAKEVPNAFKIFVCTENNYLATSYVNAICEAMQLEKEIVDSIYSQASALSLVMNFENNLRVVYADTFEEVSDDYSQFTNTIVICSKIDKKISRAISSYIITVPKMQEWQVLAYIKSRCPVLSEQDITELYKAAGGDIYYLESELEKICLFDAPEQGAIAVQLVNTQGTRRYDLTSYEVVAAIMRRDLETLKKYLKYAKRNGNDFLGLVALLITQVKGALFADYSSKTPQDVGMSEGQFYAIKRNSLGLSMIDLQHRLTILTSLDLQLKSGLLDIPNARQIDYLIAKLVV